jgi:hypothetical protein
MTTIVTAHSTSLDGFIAGAGDSHKCRWAAAATDSSNG